MTALFAAVPTANLQTPWEWCVAILSIVLIDIVLAGDNAVVIALAVRTLPPKERLMGIILGSAVAVTLRVGLTFVAAHQAHRRPAHPVDRREAADRQHG